MQTSIAIGYPIRTQDIPQRHVLKSVFVNATRRQGPFIPSIFHEKRDQC